MRAERIAPLLLTSLLALVMGGATAQSARIEAGATATSGHPAEPLFGVRFEGFRLDGNTVTLEVGYADGAHLGVGSSTNRAFGPLGNIVFEWWGAVRSDGKGEARVGARGVLGPVAVRIALVGFSAPPGAFRPDASDSAERPVLGGPAFGVQVGATARLSRNLILEAEPELYLEDGVALRLESRLRMLRLLGENEVDVIGLAYGSPGLTEGNFATGVALVLPRGRGPAWSFAALLGWSELGFQPGVRLSVSEAVGTARFGVDAAYEPYRLDVAPFRARAQVAAPAAGGLGGGRWEATALATSDFGAPVRGRAVVGSSLTLGIALTVPLEGSP